MKPFICRVPSLAISGYKKLIHKTVDILKDKCDLTLFPIEGFPQEKSDFNFGKITKENFKNDELIISSLPLDRYASLTNVLPDKDNISFITMWESTYLPRFSVEELNYFQGKILVPSLWNLDTFKISGVKRAYYLPLFVDDKFQYNQKNNLDRFTFCAGACSATSSGNSQRKNFDIILSAFRKAFKNVKDVEIKFKLSICDKPKLSNVLDDRISFNYKNLTDLEVYDYLKESDVFVTSAKAEGWGFFQIESLAIGRPVITANYGGVKDFCNNENSFFVDYEEQLAVGSWGKNGGCWAEVKEESLIEQMRYCYENKDTIRHNWQKYSQSVLPKFSLKNYEQNLIAALDLK